MKLYKLTDRKMQTYNDFQFELNKIYKKKKVKNPRLCTSDVYHAYANKNLALLMNPAHANISNPLVFEAEGEIAVQDPTKVGVFDIRLTKKLRLPKWYKDKEMRKKVCVQFAILCTEEVLHVYEEKYPDDERPRQAIKAAREWLKNPCKETAYAAYAADAAARNAADAAARNAAVYAARAAAYATAAYCDAYAAARAAANAANAAAWAAACAAYAAADETIDLCKLADKAVMIVGRGDKGGMEMR